MQSSKYIKIKKKLKSGSFKCYIISCFVLYFINTRMFGYDIKKFLVKLKIKKY